MRKTKRHSLTNECFEASARRFEALFAFLPIACFTMDLEGTVFEWNHAAEEMFEKPASDVFQRPYREVLEALEDIERFDLLVHEARNGGSSGSADFRVLLSGRTQFISVSALVMRSQTGEPTGILVAGVDFTAQRALQEQVQAQLEELSISQNLLLIQKDELSKANRFLEEMATTDGLTGLKNHRDFQEFLERQFSLSKRTGAPLSVLMLDVDCFKALNDIHGHQVGDRVLQAIAEILQRVARRSDYVARYGGEEFVVVLPSTGAAEAILAAERLRKAIESAIFTAGQITASFGCATLKESDASRAHLVARADEALYHSKRSGRNCTTHCDEVAQAA